MKRVPLLILFVWQIFNVSAQQPNILWITTEDISPTLSMYGDSTAQTPNLDKLAAESLIYQEAYTTVGVCAPSRSSLITGMYPVSIGTHQMRTGDDSFAWGNRSYEGDSKHFDINGNYIPLHSVVTPPEVKCFTEYLRKAGYFCTNNAKTDYQFAAPVTAWDQNGKHAHWKNRRPGQPFFSVFNTLVTHESKMWSHEDKPLTVNPDAVPLPEYFPNTSIIRRDVARHYSNVELLDKFVGKVISELEKAGQLDNTIIFFFSDHGGPFPRGKREHYVSGLRVPLMIRIPGRLKQQYISDPVSFVDFAPTVLSLANVEIPDHLQGQAFLGNQKSNNPRKYIYGSGDRFDEHADRIRSVISNDFVYVRNYHPDLPAYKDVKYRRNMKMTNELLDLHAAGKLSDKEAYWFRQTKTKEEFYLRASDPYSLQNIIEEPKYKKEIGAHRRALKQWQNKIDDLGAKPEKKHFEDMWPGGIQPQTETPIVNSVGGQVSITCQTEGASIAYLIRDEKIEPSLDDGWKVYSEPVTLMPGQVLFAMATRIGFEDSEILITKR
ncbi:sulfatase [Reichenbachiella sp.]|uniref:sulfatase family protein n=1 Tax=Reichenbachiella sp. TaxID=2184521 RepID=UPI00329692AE